eukprot:9027271-Pyramimonas_sp.AAC.1
MGNLRDRDVNAHVNAHGRHSDCARNNHVAPASTVGWRRGFARSKPNTQGAQGVLVESSWGPLLSAPREPPKECPRQVLSLRMCVASSVVGTRAKSRIGAHRAITCSAVAPRAQTRSARE